jgi:type II secretory pathway pseudopilin PulG
MTLIEVLAGLVVLGTVLASVTIARGRFMFQAARAQQKLQATRAVDEMLSSWLSGPPQNIPVPSQGAIGGSSTLIWRTQYAPHLSAQSLDAHVVRIDVVDRANRGEVVLSIDFLVHDFAEAQ